MLKRVGPLILVVCFCVIVRGSSVGGLFGMLESPELLSEGDITELNWKIMSMMWESDYGSNIIDIRRCKNPPDSLCTYAKAEIKV